MRSINPYTGETVFEHKKFTQKEIENGIINADSAYRKWKLTSVKERSKLFEKLADILEKNKEKYAEIITLEMGKPITQAVSEVEKCAWVCRYYAENAEKQLSPENIKTEASESYVRFEPLGVILGVMPWNFPFWQVFRFAIPTIIAGNTVLLKHASNVMESVKKITSAFTDAGFPSNVFIHLLADSSDVEKIIRHPLVKGVSLTGSKPAGAAVASVAGEEIKPSLLELGGSNALVVFEDHPENTVETVLNARFLNTGQSCIAGKRLLLHEKIADEFLEKLTRKINELKSGDPLNKDTFIGTMVNEEAAKQLYDQLQSSLNEGAELVTGGNYHGAYFEPTLIKNVTREMTVFKEETFGPLLACTTFKNEEEAVELVNESEFGLGVSIFTKDKKRTERMIPLFEEGAVFVNELVKSDPRIPFGGIKISGYGRELSQDGILAFVNKKTVFIK